MIIGRTHYEVMWTPAHGPQDDTNREVWDFAKFSTAARFAERLEKEGRIGVIVDRFNASDDYEASWRFINGAWKQVV